MAAKRFFCSCAGLFCLAGATVAAPPLARTAGYVYVTQWGSFGGSNGQFSSPYGVATDAAGNVYVADQFNHRIQKFTSTGTYLTQWGSYGGGSGQFFGPVGLAIDAAGQVYVADSNNHRIQTFTTAGTYVTQWGSHGSGNGQFDYPIGVGTDAAGNFYVADGGNHRIQKFAPNLTPASAVSWGGVKARYRQPGPAAAQDK